MKNTTTSALNFWHKIIKVCGIKIMTYQIGSERYPISGKIEIFTQDNTTQILPNSTLGKKDTKNL